MSALTPYRLVFPHGVANLTVRVDASVSGTSCPGVDVRDESAGNLRRDRTPDRDRGAAVQA